MSAHRTSILIIEDERPWAQFLNEFLSGLGYLCRIAESGQEGLDAFREEPTDVVLTDLRLPDIDGMEVTRTIRATDPESIIIMMTGYATSEAAIQAFECGATDYITKPFNANQIHLSITRVLEHRRVASENERLRRLVESRSCFDQIVGAAPAMQAIYKLIEQVAPSETPVLILGEKGTGKSLVAEAIHHASGRPSEMFETLSCAGGTPAEIEAALFGLESRNQDAMRLGVLERAGDGTVFLEDLEALPEPLQARLQATLQEHLIPHNGSGRRSAPLRARTISASSASLLEATEHRAFRRDLYYRLSVVTINLPPLRERREDIPLLANFFLEKSNRRHGKHVEKFAFEALMVLSTYSWPGNVAELESEIDALVERDTAGLIRVSDLSGHLQREMSASDSGVSAANVPLKEAKKRFEREYFKDLLRRTKGNMSLASRSSRVGRPYLYKKIADYDIDPNEFR
jgi:DNA-binding NtrC family response regulator